jgi:hypothetical protein
MAGGTVQRGAAQQHQVARAELLLAIGSVFSALEAGKLQSASNRRSRSHIRRRSAAAAAPMGSLGLGDGDGVVIAAIGVIKGRPEGVCEPHMLQFFFQIARLIA